MNRPIDPERDVLLADIGGTNARFALARPSAAAPLRETSIRRFRVTDYASLPAMARDYLQQAPGPGDEAPARAVVAVAGRVEADRARLTNHAWTIDAPALRAELSLDSVRLVNDFAAVSQSLPLLGAGDLLPLGAAVEAMIDRGVEQTFCVLGPGTGLGVAALALRGGSLVGLSTEGGHVGFAPSGAEQIEVLRRLSDRFGRVSLEHLLCGSGLVNLHAALCAMHGTAAAGLSPEAITARAREGSDATCVQAAAMFCDVLAAAAGDFALAYGAWGGVYLAGGLLTPLAPWLQAPRFRERFEDKGRFARAVQKVPLAWITHPAPGLLGAAAIAMSDAGRPVLRRA